MWIWQEGIFFLDIADFKMLEKGRLLRTSHPFGLIPRFFDMAVPQYSGSNPLETGFLGI